MVTVHNTTRKLVIEWSIAQVCLPAKLFHLSNGQKRPGCSSLESFIWQRTSRPFELEVEKWTTRPCQMPDYKSPSFRVFSNRVGRWIDQHASSASPAPTTLPGSLHAWANSTSNFAQMRTRVFLYLCLSRTCLFLGDLLGPKTSLARSIMNGSSKDDHLMLQDRWRSQIWRAHWLFVSDHKFQVCILT